MMYQPKISSGDNVALEKANQWDQSKAGPKVNKVWVCWQCEESTVADGPDFTRANVDKFLTDHQGCDRDPYQDFPLGE
jgi:hypothetical protein